MMSSTNADKLIRTVVLNGTIDHLRAIIERMMILYSEPFAFSIWEEPSGPGRATWWVKTSKTEFVPFPLADTYPEFAGRYVLTSKKGHAAIEAYELLDTVRVDFLDGYRPDQRYCPGADVQPIGERFKQLAAVILAESGEQDPTQDAHAPERQKRPSIREREETVARLWAEGLTDNEIQAETTIPASTVKSDRLKMGLKRPPRRV